MLSRLLALRIEGNDHNYTILIKVCVPYAYATVRKRAHLTRTVFARDDERSWNYFWETTCATSLHATTFTEPLQ